MNRNNRGSGYHRRGSHHHGSVSRDSNSDSPDSHTPVPRPSASDLSATLSALSERVSRVTRTYNEDPDFRRRVDNHLGSRSSTLDQIARTARDRGARARGHQAIRDTEAHWDENNLRRQAEVAADLSRVVNSARNLVPGVNHPRVSGRHRGFIHVPEIRGDHRTPRTIFMGAGNGGLQVTGDLRNTTITFNNRDVHTGGPSTSSTYFDTDSDTDTDTGAEEDQEILYRPTHRAGTRPRAFSGRRAIPTGTGEDFRDRARGTENTLAQILLTALVHGEELPLNYGAVPARGRLLLGAHAQYLPANVEPATYYMNSHTRENELLQTVLWSWLTVRIQTTTTHPQ